MAPATKNKYDFLFSFCKPVIFPWTLRENNAYNSVKPSQSERTLYRLQTRAI